MLEFPLAAQDGESLPLLLSRRGIGLAKRVFELEKENSLLRVKQSTSVSDFPLAAQDCERMKTLLTHRELGLEREKLNHEAEQEIKAEHLASSSPSGVEKSTVRTSTVESRNNTRPRHLFNVEICECDDFDYVDD